MKNKKGLLGLGIGSIALILFFAILVIIVAFIFLSINKVILVGVAIAILTLIFGFRGEFTRTKGIFMAIFIGLGLILIIFNQGISQNIISQSEVKLENGKVFWLITATANNIDEGFRFINKPDNFITDDLEVRPQKSFDLFFSKSDSGCTYQVERKERRILLGLKKVEYFLMNTPERFADIKITDRNGKSVIMDGTVVDAKTIKDPDGKGEIVIQTQGLLGGKKDCPSATDVAIVVEDNQVIYFDQSQLEDFIDGLRIFPSLRDLTRQVDRKNSFTNAFNNVPIFNGIQVTGKLDIGNVVFTATADQDYFDSVVFIPPKEVDPNIVSISIPNEIEADSTSSMKVIIENKKSTSGTILVEATSNDASITPSAQNVQLSDRVSLNYVIKTANVDKISSVRVEACWTGQFGGKNCDVLTQSFAIVKEEVKDTCGDGICQSNEAESTCPDDCTGVPEPELDCKFYQVERFQNEVDRTFLNRLGFGEPTVISKPVCKTDPIVWLIAGGLIILILGTLFILTRNTKGRKR